MGAERIIAMSRHEKRQQLAKEFGATDVVTERGDEGVERIKEITRGIGADSVLECVGSEESMKQAIRCTRPGGSIGDVRVPYGTPTWIWSVVVDGALYVRAYNGQNSRWYQAALQQRAGRITAAGVMKDVAFEPVESAINVRIDDAYRAKYKESAYLAPMIGSR